MAKIEVPADTLPVLGVIELVATIPVPASPSGGQNGIPAFSVPVSSKSKAPPSVSLPAFSPAVRTFGNTLFRSNPVFTLNFSSISGL